MQLNIIQKQYFQIGRIQYLFVRCIQICKLEPKVRKKKGNFEFDDSVTSVTYSQWLLMALWLHKQHTHTSMDICVGENLSMWQRGGKVSELVFCNIQTKREVNIYPPLHIYLL